MSGYISSYIIDSVYRQARRLSNTRPYPWSNGAPNAPPSPAHVSPSSSDRDTNFLIAHDDDAIAAGGASARPSDLREVGTFDNAYRPPTDISTPPESEDIRLPARHERLRLSERGATLQSTYTDYTVFHSGHYSVPASLRTESRAAERVSFGMNTGETRSWEGSGRAEDISQSPVGNQGSGAMSESLPEDDGFKTLRQRLQLIQGMNATNDEKAQRMHHVMTERYISSHSRLQKQISPPHIALSERPLIPGSSISALEGSTSLHFMDLDILDVENPYNLDEEVLKPSYRPKPAHQDSEEGLDGEENEPELGCQHYKRNVKIQCYDCSRWYPCRFCHDASESHTLNRRKTRHMLCMLCQHPQTASETCIKCGEDAACYYCPICKLWDDDSSKSIYHCRDCGICRRGEGLGKDFEHCKKCNVCISIAFATSHKCIERATECDCPICGEYMFNSPQAVVSMKCGHYMHSACHREYMKTAYKCPICSRSAVNMELQWRKLDHAIEAQPMPVGFRGHRAIVLCNDCSVRSCVPYHWLGNKCARCDSYNTNEIKLLGEGEEPPPDLGREESVPETIPLAVEDQQQQQQQHDEVLPATASTFSRGRESHPSRGSYFLTEGQQHAAAATTIESHPQESDQLAAESVESMVGSWTGNISSPIPFSPYQMAQRLARSLSPMPHLVRSIRASNNNIIGNAAMVAQAEGSESLDGVIDSHSQQGFPFWDIRRRFLAADGEPQSPWFEDVRRRFSSMGGAEAAAAATGGSASTASEVPNQWFEEVRRRWLGGDNQNNDDDGDEIRKGEWSDGNISMTDGEDDDDRDGEEGNEDVEMDDDGDGMEIFGHR